MRSSAYVVVTVLVLALLAACSSDSEDGATSTPSGQSPTTDASATGDPTGTDPAAPTATPAPFTLSTTVLIAPLTSTYKTGASVPPAADELPFPPDGSVEARWYQSDGHYVVHYAGLVLADIGPVCPRNSIKIVTDIKHRTNSPASEGACTGAPTLATPPAGVKICDGEVLYLTEIPTDLLGELRGTVERHFADGTIVGLTSFVDADASAAPEVDLRTCTPAVP